jgi:hypothetical protein
MLIFRAIVRAGRGKKKRKKEKKERVTEKENS